MRARARGEYLEVNRNRYIIYSFLSKVYEKEITTDLLKEITKKESHLLHVNLGLMESGRESAYSSELAKGFDLLRGYLEGLTSRDMEEVRLELAAEYADLFLGIKQKPSHPSESAYMSHGLVMQKARDDVLKAYQDAGVDKAQEYTEPEDHIAVELQFMAYLCQRTIEALEKNKKHEAKECLRMQKDFHHNHLASWVPKFTKDILESAELDFYKGIANITDGFIKMDRNTLDELISEIQDL